jgi:hypothetical protein
MHGIARDFLRQGQAVPPRFAARGFRAEDNFTMLEGDDVSRRRIIHEFAVQRGDARIGNDNETNLGQLVQDGSFEFGRGDVLPRTFHGFRRRR